MSGEIHGQIRPKLLFEGEDQVQLSLKPPAFPGKYMDKQIRPELLLEGEGTVHISLKRPAFPGKYMDRQTKLDLNTS